MTDAPDDHDFYAHECPDGHLTYPAHSRCPECGQKQTGTVDLSDHIGQVRTWTRVTATPTGVRSPNTLAVVEFDIDGRSVRALGGTTNSVSTGDEVVPVYVEQLRDPDRSIRQTASQVWHGFRFEPRG